MNLATWHVIEKTNPVFGEDFEFEHGNKSKVEALSKFLGTVGGQTVGEMATCFELFTMSRKSCLGLRS